VRSARRIVSDVRARITWLVLAAVAALGVAAAVDALRGEDSSAPSEARRSAPPTTTTQPVAVEQALAEQSVGGVLYYTDENCELRAVELPSLHPAPTPVWDECRFSLSADARTVGGADAAMTSPPVSLREGAVVETKTGRVLVPARALRRALHEDPNIPPGSTRFLRLRSVKEAAWLGESRLVAVLATEQASGPPQDFIGVFEGRRVVRIVRGLGWLFSDLRPSPRGSFFAVTATNGAGFVLFDRDGGPAPAPPVTGYRAIAWSPDERWAVLATRASVYVFRAGTTNMRLRRLDFTARDLAWRDEASSPRPIAGQESLRAWAEGAGAEGTLFVSDAVCRLRALRLPELEWVEPRGGGIVPCRFAVDAEGFVLPENVITQPGGRLRAACRDGAVDVYDPAEARVARYPDACAPAWRPDGSLTFVRDGELVHAWARDEERIVLSREGLARAIGPGARLQEVAWIGDDELWAVVQRGGDAILAGFRDGQLAVPPSYSSSRIENLQASVGLVALESEGAVLIFDGGGRRLMTISGARAISWRPGSRVVAVAGPRELLLVAPHSREVAVVPLQASDVEWR
jgi:hypothetical protein